MTLDYKPVINELPYGFEIPGKVSSSFFRIHDIRSVDGESFMMLYRKYVSKKEPIPFIDKIPEYERFYIVPFYAKTTFRTDYIVALDKNLNIYRMAKSDPQPFNFAKVSSSSSIYVAPDWKTYVAFTESHRNSTLNFNECCIIIDSNVAIETWWVSELQDNKRVVFLESVDEGSTEYTFKLLKATHIPFSIDDSFKKPREPEVLDPIKKDIPIQNILNATDDQSDDFLTRSEIVNRLEEEGITVTYDTLQKVTRELKVPHTNNTYSYRLMKKYFEYKNTGLTRAEAFKKANSYYSEWLLK